MEGGSEKRGVREYKTIADGSVFALALSHNLHNAIADAHSPPAVLWECPLLIRVPAVRRCFRVGVRPARRLY